MRLLFLLQGRTAADHPGWRDGCERLVKSGELSACKILPIFKSAEDCGGWDGFYEHVLAESQALEADLVFFHYFHHPFIPTPEPCIKALREQLQNPLIFVSCGDPFSPDWRPQDFPPCFKTASSLADLTLSTSMGRCADRMQNWGAKCILHLPNGCCQVRFGEVPPIIPDAEKDFDLAFIGSNNRFRNPLGHHFWTCRERKKIVRLLAKRYGKRFGLFGNGWSGIPSWQGPVPFDQQQAAMQRSRLVFGGYPHIREDYYTSNRVFNSIASGVPFVDMSVPRLGHILRAGEHWYPADSATDLISTIDRLLESDSDDLAKRARQAAHFIQTEHSHANRMDYLIGIARQFRAAKLDGKPFPRPELSYLLPEIDQDKEFPYATRGWA